MRKASKGRRNGADAAHLARTLAGLMVLVLVLPYLLTPLYAIGRPVSTLMIGRWLSFRSVQRAWVPLEAMGRTLPVAVIVAEDSAFCSHGGIDWEALRKALADASDGQGGGGGSTITQQVAKNLFLWPGRSYLRKALEIPLALWLDLVLSKRRILEIYLNIAEWGPGGQFGAGAGAHYAFAKPVSRLTRREAALMAAVLPNPAVRSAKRPNPRVRRRGAVYSARIAAAGEVSDCLRATKSAEAALSPPISVAGAAKSHWSGPLSSSISAALIRRM